MRNTECCLCVFSSYCPTAQPDHTNGPKCASCSHSVFAAVEILWMVFRSVPKRPAGTCSSAGQVDSDRRAGTASCRSAASHTDWSSLALREKDDVKSHRNQRLSAPTHENTLTYVHGQVHTLTDLRKAKHLFPLPASAFTPSTCRRQSRAEKTKLFQAVVLGKHIRQGDDECRWLTRLSAVTLPCTRTCTPNPWGSDNSELHYSEWTIYSSGSR